MPRFDLRRFGAAVVAAACFGGAIAAHAEFAADAVQTHCITPLHTGAALGEGLQRAPKDMEAKLLNGKIARLYRTDDPQILVVAHESGQTCEIMALGADLGAFGAAIEAWEIDDTLFTASADSLIKADAPSGGYYVAPRGEDGFIQVFVTSRPDARFVGVTVARVPDGAMARQVLGID